MYFDADAISESDLAGLSNKSRKKYYYISQTVKEELIVSRICVKLTL